MTLRPYLVMTLARSWSLTFIRIILTPVKFPSPWVGSWTSLEMHEVQRQLCCSRDSLTSCSKHIRQILVKAKIGFHLSQTEEETWSVNEVVGQTLKLWLTRTSKGKRAIYKHTRAENAFSRHPRASVFLALSSVPKLTCLFSVVLNKECPITFFFLIFKLQAYVFSSYLVLSRNMFSFFGFYPKRGDSLLILTGNSLCPCTG